MRHTRLNFAQITLPFLLIATLQLSGCFNGVPSTPNTPGDGAASKSLMSQDSSSTEGVAPSRVKEASTLNEEAVTQLEAGETEAALKTLEEAHTLAPHNLVISENMARALEANQQLPKARDAYEALSLQGALPEEKRNTYLLRSVDLNIKLAEAKDDTNKWNERKVNDVLMRLNTAVAEDVYVDRVDILRGYYNIDPKG
jgi:Flp pilus assembly protein TadD